jgi:putative acetyltransferase
MMRQMPMVSIRRLQPADVSALHALHTLAVRKECAPYLEPAAVEAWLRGRTAEAYQRAADEEGENFWVAVEKGEMIVGFASWRDDTLLALFIHPDRQDRGIGRALFERCEVDAKDSGFQILRLNATLNAESYYEQFGFQRAGTMHRERFGQRIPLITMARRARR